MKLLFKQRMFSWFHTYDIYDEYGNTVFTVQGAPAWGHLLRIYDALGNEVGYIKEKVFSWMPQFYMYLGQNDEKGVSVIRPFSLKTLIIFMLNPSLFLPNPLKNNRT